MSALNNKLDPLVLARAVGTGGAGAYFLGLQLAELPTREIAFPVTRAIYPGLSELQESPSRANLAFLSGVEAMAAIAMPAAIGFALIARDVIPLLLGQQWAQAAGVVEIITPVMGVQMPLLATQYYAMALGSTRLVFFREVIFFCVRTPVFIWAAIAFGIHGAAWAVAACGMFHILLNLALYSRTSQDRFYRPLLRAWRSFAAAAVMTATLTAFGRTGWGDQTAPILRVGIEVVCGIAVYGSVHLLLWRAAGAPDGVERLTLRFLTPIAAKLVRQRD